MFSKLALVNSSKPTVILVIDSGLVGRNVFFVHHIRPVVSGAGEVPRGEKMLYSGTDPESYITEYTL